MPNSKGKIIKRDLQEALYPAELDITTFKPPAAGPDPLPEPPDLNFHISLPDIQVQIAEKSAIARANALFPFLETFTKQIVNEEIDKRPSTSPTTTTVGVDGAAGPAGPAGAAGAAGVDATYRVSLTNNTVSTISAGTPVYVSGVGAITSSRANASATAIVFGIVEADILTTTSGNVIFAGMATIPAARQTGTWVAGDTIYLDDLAVGKLTNVKPTTATTYVIEIGQITTTPAGASCILYLMKTSRILN